MDRLLFVDDDIDILTLNHSYFTEQGYAVDQAGSAKDALLLINRNTYDCIILDIQMEGQDGFALCRVLREMSNIPIIFLTVYCKTLPYEGAGASYQSEDPSPGT